QPQARCCLRLAHPRPRRRPASPPRVPSRPMPAASRPSPTLGIRVANGIGATAIAIGVTGIGVAIPPGAIVGGATIIGATSIGRGGVLIPATSALPWPAPVNRRSLARGHVRYRRVRAATRIAFALADRPRSLSVRPAPIAVYRRTKYRGAGGSTTAAGGISVHGPLEAEVFAQRPALVFLAEQAAALQLGRNHFHEILAPARQVGWRDIEAVAAVILEPLLHNVGNVWGCANQTEAAHAGDLLVELADCRVLPSHPRKQLCTDAAQFGGSELVERNRTIEGVAREVTEGLAEARQADEWIEQLLELLVLRASFLGRPAHHRAEGWQYFQVFGAALIPRHSSLEVGIECLRHLQRRMHGVNEIGRRRSQLSPLFGGSRLHHDGMNLGQAADVQGSPHGKEGALMVQYVHFGFVEELTRSFVERKSILLPAV